MYRSENVCGPAASKVNRFLARASRRKFSAFTLAELIVVIAVLAVLATVGFLSLSSYRQDASDAARKANVRSVYSAIVSESARTDNSPRYYVVHDSNYSLTGGAVVVFDGSPVTLTGGDWNVPGTNYSAGNPDYAKLRMNKEKFRLTSLGDGITGFFSSETSAAGATEPGYLLVGAVSVSENVNGKPRLKSFIQVAGSTPSAPSVVVGDYSAGSGSVAGLVKDVASSSSSGALVDGANA